jgi:ubiquinone biosynthesis protein COQ9
MTDNDAKARVLDAALAHVPFDGWSDHTLQAAMTEAGLDPALGRVLFPRGGVDLALAYHARGDAEMVARLAATDLSALRFRDRIATAIRTRLEFADREVVRRGTTLFALPYHAADGAAALWHTADNIWTVLGDTSQDFNWYTKRATLSAVHAATVLFWLGDETPEHQATWDFLDRRIESVMQFEKLKGKVQGNSLAKALMAGPVKLMETLRPARRSDTPS